MAVPFRRTSKTKKRMRRTHLKKSVGTTTKCPNCGATIKPHRVCSKCGFYKGKEVISNEKDPVSETKEINKKLASAEKKTSKKTKKAKEA